MPLDFNTLEPIKGPTKQNSVNSAISDNNRPGSLMSGSISRTQAFLPIAALSFSMLALLGVLYTLSHIPQPEPISIQCSLDLLKKIENQAKILEEIAKKTKSQK